MKVTISILLTALSVFGADISGKWSGGPFFLIFKQEGTALTGTGGPFENEQYPFQNGKVDGNHVTFKIAAFETDLQLEGEELRGTVKNGDSTQQLFLKRVPAAPASGGPPPSFDVASVKRAPPADPRGGRSSMNMDPGRLVCSNVSIRKLIVESYRMKEYQVAGPDWILTELYDIVATMPPATSGDQVLQMMQTLLADRFKLALHRETKEMPAYALVIGKTGSKLEETELGRGSTSSSSGKLVGTKVPIRNLVEALSRQADLPVVDMTGLKGVYNFTLEYTPESRTAAAKPGETPDGPTGPSIYTAIQEQLGLKLEARKIPMEMLVIDRVEKIPVEN